MSVGLYRPANGTEGSWFMSQHCGRCKRDQAFSEGTSNAGCPIIALSMVFDTDDDEYPREWRYDDNGDPTCTAFDRIDK